MRLTIPGKEAYCHHAKTKSAAHTFPLVDGSTPFKWRTSSSNRLRLVLLIIPISCKSVSVRLNSSSSSIEFRTNISRYCPRSCAFSHAATRLYIVIYACIVCTMYAYIIHLAILPEVLRLQPRCPRLYSILHTRILYVLYTHMLCISPDRRRNSYVNKVTVGFVSNVNLPCYVFCTGG